MEVTNLEIQSDIQRGLGRVEGKVDLIINRMDSQDKKIADQNQNITDLTKKVYTYSGIISLAMSGITAYVLHWIKG